MNISQLLFGCKLITVAWAIIGVIHIWYGLLKNQCAELKKYPRDPFWIGDMLVVTVWGAFIGPITWIWNYIDSKRTKGQIENQNLSQS